jgi:hypothetical protein
MTLARVLESSLYTRTSIGSSLDEFGWPVTAQMLPVNGMHRRPPLLV